MNEVLQVPDANLNASLSGNALKISYDRVGPHKVRDISGAAKTVMFYDTEGRRADTVDDWIQLGANIEQGVSLQRFSMSTISMGINSLVISGNKYANKALARLDEALGYLNAKRSLYGAKQNRFEYTIKGNDNTSENLQASESRDRDADMAEEVIRFSKSNILQQTGNAVLTQANQHAEMVLSLIQSG